MSDKKKVAVVTGGIRGIGLAISQALMCDGHIVAAVYFGNNEAAAKFEEASEGKGKAFKFDVANFNACERGIAEIEEALGRKLTPEEKSLYLGIAMSVAEALRLLQFANRVSVRLDEDGIAARSHDCST